MIECHPVLRPFVNAAKPVVHAVRHWHPHHHIVGVRHHLHRIGNYVHHAIPAAPTTTTVMTVCQRVAGPLLAGGVALLPPASGVPAGGGVGGFPGYAPSEYGAPGYYGPGPYAGPGYYGGPGYAGGGILAPGGGSSGPTSLAPSATPVVLASNTPTTTAETPSSSTSPGLSTPATPTTSPTSSTTPTPSTTSPTVTPPGGETPPGQGTQPGESTPTPEPASLALLGAGIAMLVAWRLRPGALRRR